MGNSLFHISARTSNKEPFPVPLSEAWNIYSDFLFALHHFYDFRIIAFVMMNNHYHLLADVDRTALSAGLCHFQTQTAKEMNRLSFRINHIYGKRYFRSEITTYHHLLNVYKYVLRNPVRAQLVTRVEHYPWSSIQMVLGQRSAPFPISGNEDLRDGNLEKTLSWLNTPSLQENDQDLRRGLKKKTFAFPSRSQHPQGHPLDQLLI